MEEKQPQEESPKLNKFETLKIEIKANPLAFTGLLISILAILSYGAPFLGVGGNFWTLGLGFSIAGLFKKPKRFAIAGLVISILSFVLKYLALILVLTTLSDS